MRLWTLDDNLKGKLCINLEGPSLSFRPIKFLSHINDMINNSISLKQNYILKNKLKFEATIRPTRAFVFWN